MTLQTETTAGPRSSKGARTRARLLTAAKEIFEENGFLEARISDIAERAGLSHGSFYTYFDSKEQIFREVAAAVDDELGAPLSDVILSPSSSGLPPQDGCAGPCRRTSTPTEKKPGSWASSRRSRATTTTCAISCWQGTGNTRPRLQRRSGRCRSAASPTATSTRPSPPRSSARSPGGSRSCGWSREQSSAPSTMRSN